MAADPSDMPKRPDIAPYPPGPSGLFPGFKLWKWRRNTVGLCQHMADEYGDFSHCRVGVRHFYFLSHPDYVRDLLVTHNKSFKKGRAYELMKFCLGEGLLTSHGEFHRSQRRMMNPAFRPDRLQSYSTAMVESTLEVCRDWTDGSARDIHQDMMRLALVSLGRSILGASVEDHVKLITDVVLEFSELMNRWSQLPFSKFLFETPNPLNRKLRTLQKELNAIVFRLMRERRQNPAGHDDLLTDLVQARDDEATGRQMTDQQIRDELVTLIVAGFETTANAMSWSWFLLAQSPDVETRFQQEVDQVLAGRLPAPADLPGLPITRGVFSEAMRLYPPIYAVARTALEDVKIGPHVIPKGGHVYASQYVLHHDARFWPEPEKFDPARWAPEAVPERPKFAYFPFGAGTRMCIGEQFAWFEGMLALSTIARHWRLELDPSHKTDVIPAITLRPVDGIHMIPRARSSASSADGLQPGQHQPVRV